MNRSAAKFAFAGLAIAVMLWLSPGAGVRASVRRPHFTDTAPRSAISYITNNSYTGRKYFQQPMCGGIGILDFDNDGHMDIFFSNGAQLPGTEEDQPLVLQLPAAQQGRRNLRRCHRQSRPHGQASGLQLSAWPWATTTTTASRTSSSPTPGRTRCTTTMATALSPMSRERSGIGKQAAQDPQRRRPPGSTTTTTACSIWWSPTTPSGLRETDRAAPCGGAEAYCHPQTLPAACRIGSTTTWATASSKT